MLHLRWSGLMDECGLCAISGPGCAFRLLRFAGLM